MRTETLIKMTLLPPCGIDEGQRASNAYRVVRMQEKEGQARDHKGEQAAPAQCGTSEDEDDNLLSRPETCGPDKLIKGTLQP